MQRARVHAGDSHNFGRRVRLAGSRVHKPRTLAWEHLVLGEGSSLRALLARIAREDELGEDAFSFLPSLRFDGPLGREGGIVERIDLAPLRRLGATDARALAAIAGRAIALFSWLGVSDLHWENLVLGRDHKGRMVFGPLDIELILGDLSLPTETKLLPDADPEYAELCRHAAGVRRLLPYLGKPIAGETLVVIAASYAQTLALLDRHAKEIARVIAALPDLSAIPIRVLLRSTADYVRAQSEPIWPPLLDAEIEQLDRGDIPYFFRLYGRAGIHFFADESLEKKKTLPKKGDVPQLDPIADLARAFRSPSRKKLREEGLFTVIGAFDHPALRGRFADDEFAITFGARTLTIDDAGESLSTKRDLSAFVGSVYLPCHCGEVRTVFVSDKTRCDAK